MLIACSVCRVRSGEGVVDVVNAEIGDVVNVENVVKRDDGAVADSTVDSFDGLIDVYRMREVFPVSSVRGERIGHFGMVGSTTFGDFARAVAWGVLTRCAIIGWGMNEVGFSHRRVLKPCA